MKVIIRNNPLAVNDDEMAIYTSPQFVPAELQWKLGLTIDTILIPELCEHLYCLTMERNGLTYYYPNPDRNLNICRHELHFPLGDDPYYYRIGLILNYVKGSEADITGYIGTHEQYKGAPVEGHTVDADLVCTMKKEIEDFLHDAKERIGKQRGLEFNHIYYINITAPGCLKEVYQSKSHGLLLAPANRIADQIVTALVLRATGHSYFDSLRFAQERAIIYCAILTICSSTAPNACAVITEISKPLIFNGSIKSLTTQASTVLYPEGAGVPMGVSPTDERLFEFAEWTMDAYASLQLKDQIKFKQLLFCFYEAQSTGKDHPTLALIGLVAGLSLLSKNLQENCAGDVTCTCCGPMNVHRKTGDRAAICQLISSHLKLAETDSEYDLLQRWSKRVYSEFRSAFVHAGSFRFESHSQSFNAKNPCFDLPFSLPSRTDVVRDQFHHLEDYRITRDALQVLFFDWLQSVSKSQIPHIELLPKLTFHSLLMPEAHICTPNRGWISLSNQVSLP